MFPAADVPVMRLSIRAAKWYLFLGTGASPGTRVTRLRPGDRLLVSLSEAPEPCR